MLAAVVPFALERGLLPAQDAVTRLRVLTRSTGTLCDVECKPQGRISYEGSARIDGVPGIGADQHPVSETAGSVCGSLLPPASWSTCSMAYRSPASTAACRWSSCRPQAFGRTLRSRDLEPRRAEMPRIDPHQAGRAVNLGDVSGSVVPKITQVASPR
jgi:hypothetical protein